MYTIGELLDCDPNVVVVSRPGARTIIVHVGFCRPFNGGDDHDFIETRTLLCGDGDFEVRVIRNETHENEDTIVIATKRAIKQHQFASANHDDLRQWLHLWGDSFVIVRD